MNIKQMFIKIISKFTQTQSPTHPPIPLGLSADLSDLPVCATEYDEVTRVECYRLIRPQFSFGNDHLKLFIYDRFRSRFHNKMVENNYRVLNIIYFKTRFIKKCLVST